VIYALETPPGYPKLADKDLGQPATDLNESVEVTGYFFKNWAYQAQDHTRLAPLLLARAPVWRPVVAPSRSLPSAGAAIAAVLAAVLVAIALACFVYYKSQSSSQFATRFDPAAKTSPENLIAQRQDKSPGER
jgi:predicted transporter